MESLRICVFNGDARYVGKVSLARLRILNGLSNDEDPITFRRKYMTNGYKQMLAAVILTAAVVTAYAEQQGTKTTVSGWVIDSACTPTKGMDQPMSKECVMACANDGPLAILRDDGTVFLAVNGRTPIDPRHQNLLPYAGQRVTATGREYFRAGLHLLTIETVTAAK
jgi:hypothetical protein